MPTTKRYGLHDGTFYRTVRLTERYVLQRYNHCHITVYVTIRYIYEAVHDTIPSTHGLVGRAELHQPID